MTKKEKYVMAHHHRKIWCYTKDGHKKGDDRWRTKVIDNGQEKSVTKATYEELILYLYDFYYYNDSKKTAFYKVAQSAYKYRVEIGAAQTATYDRAMNTLNATIAKYPMAEMPIQFITEKILADTMVRIRKDIPMSRTHYGNIKALVNITFDYAYGVLRLKSTIDTRRFFKTEVISKAAFTGRKVTNTLQTFTNQEILALKKAAMEHPEDIRYVAVLFAILTGLRNGELVALQISDVDTSTGILSVKRAEQRYKENGKTIYTIGEPKTEDSKNPIVLPPAALYYYEMIRKYDEDHGYKGWLLQDEKGRTHTYDMDKAIRRLCEIAGIPVRSMHKCRKTTASILIDDLGWDKEAVKNYMRHADYSTTERAYHYSRRSQMERYEQADQFAKFWGRITSLDKI